MAAYAVAGAEKALAIFEDAAPNDSRPRDAIAAARAFAGGGRRGKTLRDTAWAALRAAREAETAAAREAARAAVAAASAAYLHPLADAHQVKHILGAAAHAARAIEIQAGDDRNVGMAHIAQAGGCAPAGVVDVLLRYPEAPPGGGRVGELLRYLDRMLRAGSASGMRIEAETVGEAWIAIASLILKSGRPGNWEGLPMIEVFRATIEVRSPSAHDSVVEAHGDPERLEWMRANFADRSAVAELGNADSYATRLYDYAHAGHDQVRWVIERIAANPSTRDATITTFQPLTDRSYIPCVSLLDFWLLDGALQLDVYAHSIDFGTKGYANLVELATLQQYVANELRAATGTLTMTVKSAHIYETELDLMRRVVAESAANR